MQKEQRDAIFTKKKLDIDQPRGNTIKNNIFFIIFILARRCIVATNIAENSLVLLILS